MSTLGDMSVKILILTIARQAYILITILYLIYSLLYAYQQNFKTLYRWLENRDGLILKGDRTEPLTVLRLADLLEAEC